MVYLLIALLVLGLFSAALGLLSHRRGESDEIVVAPGDCASCGGSNALCEQECTMQAAVKPVVYYDDEELDAYRGRPSDSFTDEETQQFADVLETLRSDEVRPWGRSLILRGINMPDGIKDEFVMMSESGRGD